MAALVPVHFICRFFLLVRVAGMTIALDVITPWNQSSALFPVVTLSHPTEHVAQRCRAAWQAILLSSA